MEFANTGDHCQQCGQQDFLPVPCSHCQGIFCSRHADHECAAKPSIEFPKVPIVQNSACHICGATSSKIELFCSNCGKSVCVKHRLPEVHDCLKTGSNRILRSGIGVDTIRKFREQGTEPPVNPEAKVKSSKKPKSAKAQALVNRMKIKFKATGNESIPISDRLYVTVDISQTGSQSTLLHIFLDKRKTIGDAIEQICRKGHIENENHLATGRQLSLRPVRDPPALAFANNVKLGDVDIEVFDGDTFEILIGNHAM